MSGWELSACGQFELATDHDHNGHLICSIRHLKTRQVVATGTPCGGLTYHVPTNDSLKTAVETAAVPWLDALAWRRSHAGT